MAFIGSQRLQSQLQRHNRDSPSVQHLQPQLPRPEQRQHEQPQQPPREDLWLRSMESRLQLLQEQRSLAARKCEDFLAELEDVASGRGSGVTSQSNSRTDGARKTLDAEDDSSSEEWDLRSLTQHGLRRGQASRQRRNSLDQMRCSLPRRPASHRKTCDLSTDERSSVQAQLRRTSFEVDMAAAQYYRSSARNNIARKNTSTIEPQLGNSCTMATGPAAPKQQGLFQYTRRIVEPKSSAATHTERAASLGNAFPDGADSEAAETSEASDAESFLTDTYKNSRLHRMTLEAPVSVIMAHA